MEEELTTPTPTEAEPESEEAPEAPPAPDTAEVERLKADLEKKERDLQRGFDEIARRERALAETRPPVKQEPVPEFDEETKRALDAELNSRVQPLTEVVNALYGSAIQSALKQVASETGIDADTLTDIARDNNLNPAGSGVDDIAAVFQRAAKIHKASTFDPDAERERLKAEILKSLEEDGVRVESVRPARAEVHPGDASYEDAPDMDSRYQAALRKLGLQK